MNIIAKAHIMMLGILDQRKAFDRVDHGFLFAAKSRLGIDKKVCNLVKIIRTKT